MSKRLYAARMRLEFDVNIEVPEGSTLREAIEAMPLPEGKPFAQPCLPDPTRKEILVVWDDRDRTVDRSEYE